MRKFLAVTVSCLVFGISIVEASDWDVLNSKINEVSTFKDGESLTRLAELQKKYHDTFELTAEQNAELTTLRYRQTAQQEMFAGKVESTVLARLRKAIESQNFVGLQSDLAAKMMFPNFAEIEKVYLSKIDGIAHGETNQITQKSGSADAFKAELGKYLSNYRKVEFADVKLLRSVTKPQNEGSEFLANVAIDVRGLSAAGKKRADKLKAVLSFTRTGDNLKLVSMEMKHALTTRLERAPAFRTVAANAGFDKGETFQRLEALRRGGYGFAIEDTNKDGQLEAFVGNYGASTLWTSKNGVFTKVSAPEIEKITLAKAAAFVDLDNDGWKDLFITRFSADKLVGDVLIFKNDKGTFKEVKNAFPSNVIRDYAMPAAIADYNNDGLLDIYVGFPGARDFSAGPTVPSKLVVHGLFVNKGNLNFEDKTKLIENFAVGAVMPHGAMASDFDMDGNIDLMVMDDQANLSPIYRNNGKGQLILNNTQMHVVNSGFGMGISSGDFNQDGLPDYLLSNATFNSINRLELSKPGSSEPVNNTVTNLGLRLFVNAGGGKFSESTNIAGLSDPGEAAGGVTVIDYDNDGLQDIYIVNGLWSGSSRDENIDSMFAIGNWRNVTHHDHLQDGLGDSNGRGTRSLYMRALMAGRTAENKTYSFAGHQRNRLFKNLGNGKFLEVGYLEGADSQADGYMSVVADIDRDGRADLVLRNCDPGAKDFKFAPVEVFQNNHKNAAGVWVALKGKKSNSSGVGAKLFATVSGKTHFREMIANNSAMQGEIITHFGLGGAKKIDKLVIKWPSGISNTYKNVEAGRHTFEEAQESIAAF